MDLPFEVETEVELYPIVHPALGRLSIPKLCSVTCKEERKILRVLGAAQRVSVPSIDEIKSAENGEGDETDGEIEMSAKQSIVNRVLDIRVGMATIALQRVKPGWAESNTNDLPIDFVNAVYQFIVNERNHWVSPDPIVEDGGKKKTGAKSPPISTEDIPESSGD